MTQEILEAIQKSLPAMQMDLLKKELDKAAKYDKLEKELQDSRNAHSALILKHDVLQKLEVEMKTEKEKAQLVQRDFELKKLEYELKVEKEKTQAIKELAYAAFRNPTVHKSYQVPVQNMGYTTQVSEITSQD